MKKRILLSGISLILTILLFSGCYTSFAQMRYSDDYNDYDEEVVYYEEDNGYPSVNVYHYYRPYYPTRFVYYDPYDFWYDEPILIISVGHHYRSQFFVNYYSGCIYPVWYPVVYRPYYTPVWYHGHHGYYAHHNHHRNYYDYKKRGFSKRKSLSDHYYGRRLRNKNYGNDNHFNKRRTSERRNSQISRADFREYTRKDRKIKERSRIPVRSIKTRNESKPKNQKRSPVVVKRRIKPDKERGDNSFSSPKPKRRSPKNYYSDSKKRRNKESIRSKSKTSGDVKEQTRKYRKYNTRRSQNSSKISSRRSDKSRSSYKENKRQSKPGSSSRSSYSKPKNSSKPASSKSRSSYKSSNNRSEPSSSGSRSSYKPGKKHSKSSSGSTQRKRRR